MDEIDPTAQTLGVGDTVADRTLSLDVELNTATAE